MTIIRLNLKKIRMRWFENRNRQQESSSYLDEWRLQQCLHCIHYIPLTGEIGADFGVCTNEVSQFDGRVMFEHDGCNQHVHEDQR